MSEKEGIWIKYECGSDPKNIISYDGNNGDILCNVADYLEESDFYVYYTKDDDGNFTVPRLSIETNSNVHWKKDSTYVEGVGEDNNLEADMLDVLEEKLKEFPRNEYADLILHDAKMLTNIDEKDLKNIPLEKEEISFLY